MPEVTDSIDKIQVLQARFELCSKKKFWKKLKKLEKEFLETQAALKETQEKEAALKKEKEKRAEGSKL